MKRAHVEIYVDKAGEWRWRLRASNGKIIADGSEGYCRRKAATNAVQRVYAAIAATPPVVEVG